MSPDAFQQAVLDWFDRHGRHDLPWQIEPTPYRVWVSEIMLQQTQVATVIPYFQGFMARFPTLADLAGASEDEVLRHWAGLGYYARGRNLLRAANILQHELGGCFPDDIDALCALPGIGRSTAGAILSIGLGTRAPILDGNVKRVLSRFAGIEGWAGEPSALRELWALSERLTPRSRFADYTQAMMDLGATLCTRRRPDCPRCPIRLGCEAHRLELTDLIPAPRPRRAVPVKDGYWLVLRDAEGRCLLHKRPPTGIWGGLWSFPEFSTMDELLDWQRSRNLAPGALEALPRRRHTFSHFHLDYVPLIGSAADRLAVEEPGQVCWISPHGDTAVPAPVRLLLDELAGIDHPTIEQED